MLDYRILVDTPHGQSARSGKAELEERFHLVIPVPEGTLRSVTAVMTVPMGEAAFFNGFQSWTHCREYGPKDRIRSLKRLPKRAVAHYGLDRYGDSYFVDYPDRPGRFHGFSYCYFRSGDQYRLIASLDERPGYTMFNYDAQTGLLTLTRDCRGVACAGEFHAFDLYIGSGSEDEVFDAWFDAMGIRPRTTAPLCGYTSWYNRYQDISQQTILADLRGCKKILEPGDLFQIDDGWEPFIGDWLEPNPEKFPEGMDFAVQRIHEAGFRAGLWLAPFVAEKDSAVYREHQDWFLKVKGENWFCGSNWSGFYALDIDNPEVQNYLRRVFDRVLNEWGFDLVKLDFLYGAAPFGTRSESRCARMMRGMEFLRELCGDKLILGCGVPLWPAFGVVDYCRIGCDVGLDWNDNALMQHAHRERVSTVHSMQNTVYRRQLDGRAFGNDPDVFFLRTENLKLTDKQKDHLAGVNALFGTVLLISDDPGTYTTDQLLRYQAVRQLKRAEKIHVGPAAITFTLHGKPAALPVPVE